MRSNLGFCGMLAIAIPAWAGATETNALSQQTIPPPPAVSTPTPNIHAPGEAAVTNSSSVGQQIRQQCRRGVSDDDILWEFQCLRSRGAGDSSIERGHLLLLPRWEYQRDESNDLRREHTIITRPIRPRFMPPLRNVLCAGSPRVSVWSFPPTIRATDDADVLNRGCRDDTGVLLPEPRLLLLPDNLLHGSDRQRPRGQRLQFTRPRPIPCRTDPRRPGDSQRLRPQPHREYRLRRKRSRHHRQSTGRRDSSRHSQRVARLSSSRLSSLSPGGAV